jgi:uncharacterized protein
MNLGFDIDGVISNFVLTFLQIANEEYGIRAKEVDIYCHDLSLVLGITRDERNQLIEQTLRRDLTLYPGAKETMQKLHQEGNNIYLLTARYHSLLSITEEWLTRNGIPYTQLLLLKEGEKYQAIANLDLIVEDCLQDALEWSNKVKDILLFDHPWNKTLNVKDLVKRVYSWDEIYTEVQKRSFGASSIKL